MEFKYSKLTDPENCPIEELQNEVARLKNISDFYDTKQLALKKFINSVYGAIASKYFIANNTAVAESITLQGQDLNHFSENSVNAYFNGIFQQDTELHKQLGISTEDAKKFDISKGKTTDTGELTGPLFDYLEGNQSMTVAGDTDSVSGDSMIYLNNEKMPIEKAFEILLYKNNGNIKLVQNDSKGYNTELIPVKNYTTLTYFDNKVVEKPINYIMRHKVSKSRYKITTESGKEVIVTGDHSCMVLRNNELISIKAKDINKDIDKIISIK